VDATTFTAGASLNRIGLAGLATIAPTAGGSVELRGPKLEIGTLSINGVNLSGGSGAVGVLQEGGNGGFLLAGTAKAPITGEITVRAPILATTGANSLSVTHGGIGGTVQLVSDGEVVVKNRILVSDKAAGQKSRAGGSVLLESRLANGTAIKVKNSAEILSLLATQAPGAGGTITFSAPNGGVEVSDATVQADRGTVAITSGGASDRTDIINSTIRGDIVKIGAFGAKGELRIGGGTISADTALKLYAGGTDGRVRFIDNVTLGGEGLKTIAGRTVSIDNNKTVTIGGSQPAAVFTDVPNYTGSGGNGSSTGSFGGKGATTKPFGSRPAF